MMSVRVVLSLAAAVSAQYVPQGASQVPSATVPTQNTATMAGNAMASAMDNAGTAFDNDNIGGYHAQGVPATVSVPVQQGVQAIGPDSMALVSGLVEAFMHKIHLQAGEKSCLESNVNQLTGDVMGTVGDIATAAKALIAGKGKIAKSSSGTLISVGMDSAVKMASLVTLVTQIGKTCLHGDAIAFLKTTLHHLQNAKYIETRFIVNGVDIAHGLADSVVAFEAQDFHRFGTDMGIALRKILLSSATATNTTRSMLPEGIPEQVIIQKATDGLMKGFFVSGSSFEITDTADPNLDIVVNLHRCIAGNSVFFKEIWMASWDLIGQLAVNGKQHGLGLKAIGQGQPKWAGELMIAMMQVPSALLKCGIGAQSQQMLLEAIQSLGDVHVKFNFPANPNEADPAGVAEGATNNMAKAVEAWTNFDFESFGYELGKLFREFVLLALPQKYSVDTTGRLQLAATTPAVHPGAGYGSASFVVIGSTTISLFALAACRSYRNPTASKAQIRHEQPLSDMEALEAGAEAAE